MRCRERIYFLLNSGAVKLKPANSDWLMDLTSWGSVGVKLAGWKVKSSSKLLQSPALA